MYIYSTSQQRRQELEKGEPGASALFVAALIVAAVMGSARAESPHWITPDTRVPSDRMLELGAGGCQYGIYNVGSWWEVGYETDNSRLATPCYSVGVRKMFLKIGSKWKLGARFAYNDLGTVHTNNVTPVVQDGSVEAGVPCDTDTLRGCLGRWQGKGYARGLSAGLVLEDSAICAGPFGCGWIPSVEAGMFLYRGKWSVDGNVENDPSHSGDLLTRFPSWEKTSEGGARWSRAKGYSSTPYLGMAVRRGPFFVSARVYDFVVARSKEPHEHSLFGKAVWQVQAGVAIPF